MDSDTTGKAASSDGQTSACSNVPKEQETESFLDGADLILK